jgi:hypothetical protein
MKMYPRVNEYKNKIKLGAMAHAVILATWEAEIRKMQ